MLPRKDITGQKIGKLTVLSYSHTSKKNGKKYRAYWNCHCDCGRDEVRMADTLFRGGRGTSCSKCKDNIPAKRHDEIIDLLKQILETIQARQ